jgi:2-methylaconitate isomerase
MPPNKLRATFMRGGTSKAVVFNREDLPADPAQWDPIFLSVMGSPDPNGRQLDGMGGGLSPRQRGRMPTSIIRSRRSR